MKYKYILPPRSNNFIIDIRAFIDPKCEEEKPASIVRRDGRDEWCESNSKWSAVKRSEIYFQIKKSELYGRKLYDNEAALQCDIRKETIYFVELDLSRGRASQAIVILDDNEKEILGVILHDSKSIDGSKDGFRVDFDKPIPIETLNDNHKKEAEVDAGGSPQCTFL